MANIGFLNANERGSFIGKIETLAFTNVIALRPVQSSNPNAPKYDMMARSAANSWIKIGALFEQVARTSGEVFYQGRIDDPSMAKPMDIALFRNDEGGYNVAWTRRRTRQESPSGRDGEEAAMPESADDGLGESTADNTRLH
jgi:uncharacterized protein (DUF736 family)